MNELQANGGAVDKLPGHMIQKLRDGAPEEVGDFLATESSKTLRQKVRKGSPTMHPFASLKQKLHQRSYEAITVRPFRHTHATEVQHRVLSLMPGLADPGSEKSGNRKDLLIVSEKGTGKSLSFLIPAIEASPGVVGNKSLETQLKREYAFSRVGTLILSPTRELATTTANESILLSRHHPGIETRLFVGGVSKRIQLRDWVMGRKDIVVTTPGRLRDLLITEPAVADAVKHTRLLVIDDAEQLLEEGYRDDIDGIIKYLPSSPERQTFVVTDTMSTAVQQLVKRVLDPDFISVDVAPEYKSPHSDTPQFHTILPSAEHQLPHLMKLLAHEQMKNPQRSKTIIYLPTTRMTQLFTTLVHELRSSCLPAGEETRVYSIHSMLSMLQRTQALDGFVNENSGHSILVTTDLSSQTIQFPKTTRVIQIGIPSSDPLYFLRLGHAARGSGTHGRGDLVLLPWEMGYLTWQLTHAPLEPLTVDELDEEIKRRAGKLDHEKEAAFSSTNSLKSLSGEVRAQRPVLVQGVKDWTTQACGLPHAPFVSDAFLARLGMTDGRTKRFGKGEDGRRTESFSPARGVWEGRGRVASRGEEREPAWKSADSSMALDPRDPPTLPEAYKTDLYGKRDPTLARDAEDLGKLEENIKGRPEPPKPTTNREVLEV
ncbi:DEAD-box ATP-dependent RNA helicase 31 [Serendipita indica DSM 11827]|nr:DEAD-box ATP-dependent RNA helicase 31 [Serendipita indica DSM 11827]